MEDAQVASSAGEGGGVVWSCMLTAESAHEREGGGGVLWTASNG